MKEKSIVNPSPIPGFVEKDVFYVPVDSPSSTLKKHILTSSKKQRTTPTGDFYLLEDKVVVYGCVGAPAATLSLEGLIASGAERIVVLGLCGSLCGRARLLDAVSITEAFSDEGTSQHYFPGRKEFNPQSDLKDMIESRLQATGLPFLTGSVVSTDAPFRETRPWLEANLEKGIDCVDMETSAVFALAEFHKLQAASLLIVSDELSLTGHKKGFLDPRLEERISAYFLPLLLMKMQLGEEPDLDPSSEAGRGEEVE